MKESERIKTELTEYIKWLNDYYKYSPITIKNYRSQNSLFLRTTPEFFNMNKKNKISAARKFVLSDVGKKRFSGKFSGTRVYAVYSFLRFLELDEMEIKKNLTKLGKQEEREHIATADYNTVIRLIEDFQKKKEKELALITALIWDSAARIRAILKLRREDIYEEDEMGCLYLTEKKGIKQKKYITEDTYALLSKYIEGLSKESKYIFFPDKKSLSMEDLDYKYFAVWSKLKNYSRKILGVGITMHWLRRGRAVKILRETKSIVKAQAILGHKSLDSTRTYLRADAEELKEIIKKEKRPW